jgi:endoglucanase
MRLKNPLIYFLLFVIPLYGQDWPKLQNTLIGFYRYQRSGLKSTSDNSAGNPYNPFYTKAGSDGKYPHSTDAVDGGWYDAGDFMKFGLPMGFAVYCLLKCYDAFPEEASFDDNNSWGAVGTKDNIPDILNEAKVGTDYLLKAVVSSSQVVRDVGNAGQDHQALSESGYANSDRLRNRSAANCDGADVPGFYAAALACMSVLYKKYDSTYAAACLQKAKDAYSFAKSHVKVCGNLPVDGATGKPYYYDSLYEDKLACAAVELFRATKEANYLKDAKDFIPADPHYDVLGYAHCADLAAFELFRQGEKTYQNAWSTDLNIEMKRVVSSGPQLVVGATVNTTNWGVCRTVGNSAFSAALLYTIRGDKRLKDYVLQQVKWLAGMNPYTKSWITQYGTGFPQNPHSRNDINLRPVRLTGGIVSGPTAGNCSGDDKSKCTFGFNDNTGEYRNTECALDYNCGAIGAVAFLRWISKSTDTVRLDTAMTAVPGDIDIKSQSETVTATLDKSVAWTVIFRGASSGAVKTFTGTGAKISIPNWKGEKDAGSADFTSEKVSVYLDTVSMKIWDVQRFTAARTSFNIMSTAIRPFGPNDKEIDNFNDTAQFVNVIGGKWIRFSDASDSAAGGKSTVPQVSVDRGPDSSKALYFILSRNAGATDGGGPYCGIKTTFKSDGAQVSLGATLADTIMFDIKPLSTNESLWVELEQADIKDRAYYGVRRQFGTANTWARIYVPLASLAQPSWMTFEKPLGIAKAVAIRFVSYGVGSDNFSIDNLRLSNMAITGVRRDAPRSFPRQIEPKTIMFYKVSATCVSYGLFLKDIQGKSLTAELFDCLGKRMLSYAIHNYAAGAPIAIKNCNLKTGIYFLRHTVKGVKKPYLSTFAVGK